MIKLGLLGVFVGVAAGIEWVRSPRNGWAALGVLSYTAGLAVLVKAAE